jgi:hypothetical protein
MFLYESALVFYFSRWLWNRINFLKMTKIVALRWLWIESSADSTVLCKLLADSQPREGGEMGCLLSALLLEASDPERWQYRRVRSAEWRIIFKRCIIEYIRRGKIRASFEFCMGAKWKGGNGGGKRDEIMQILFLFGTWLGMIRITWG